MIVFTGSSNTALAQRICQNLNAPLGSAKCGTFKDGEVHIQINENVRGKDIFIVQSICPPDTNRCLMELLLMTDALRRSSAKRVNAIIPYLGYARQDRRAYLSREPISAKVVAKTIQGCGADRVLTIDLHTEQIQGFFDIPVDNIYTSPLIAEDIFRTYDSSNVMVVSPDIGGVARARATAKSIDSDLAIVDKRRPQPGEAQVMHVIGNVEGKDCIIIDDIIDTGNTLCQVAKKLKEEGANSVRCYASHALFSENAVEKIAASALNEVIVMNTVPLRDTTEKIRQLDCALMLAKSIQAIHSENSILSLYDNTPMR